MASAGRILIMPKGDWNAETEYEMLDLVHYNGTAWLAIKSVVSVEPSDANSEYWFKFGVINSQDYLSTKGGKLSGQLGVGGGKCVINGNDYGAVLQSFIDEDNYRSMRIDNPSQASTPENWLKLVDCVNGAVSQYKILGEHNYAKVMSNYLVKKTIAIGSKENPLVISAGESNGANVDIALDGYIPIAVSGFKLNSDVSFMMSIYISGSSLYYRVKNDSSNDVSLQSADVYILYKKDA